MQRREARQLRVTRQLAEASWLELFGDGVRERPKPPPPPPPPPSLYDARCGTIAYEFNRLVRDAMAAAAAYGGVIGASAYRRGLGLPPLPAAAGIYGGKLWLPRPAGPRALDDNERERRAREEAAEAVAQWRRARRLLAACVPRWRVRRGLAAIVAAVSAVSAVSAAPMHITSPPRLWRMRRARSAAGGALTCVLLVVALLACVVVGGCCGGLGSVGDGVVDGGARRGDGCGARGRVASLGCNFGTNQSLADGRTAVALLI